MRSLPLVLLSACAVDYYEGPGDSAVIDDTAAADTAAAAQSGGPGEGEGGDGGGGGGGADPNRPVVEAADAWCYHHQTGDERWIWAATAQVSDPQGLHTIQPVTTEGIAVFAGGSQLAVMALVCDPEGECTASWGADEIGTDCSVPEAYEIVFSVLDEDAKRSAPYVVTGRLGSSAEG